MPVQPDQRFRFFVYIVESPSAHDLYHKRSESDLLRNVLELSGIKSASRLVISAPAFYAALVIGVTEVMRDHPLHMPILHLSAHGDRNGIQLSNGDLIDWASLGGLLQPINRALGGALIVAMSCCEGYSGIVGVHRCSCGYPPSPRGGPAL